MRGRRPWGERFGSGLAVFAWESAVLLGLAVVALVIAAVVLALV